MLVNTILIPIMGASVKTLAEMGVGTLEMLTWRAELVLLLLLPFLLKAEHRAAVRTADIKAHAVHAAFAIATMACFYFALRTLPLATVTSINFTTPIFALLLAHLLFGERVSLSGWLAMGAGFLGTVLILRPDASGIGLDVLVVLVGSILAAGMNLAVRRMPARSSNFAVVFYLSLFGAIFYALVGGASLTVPTPTEFGLFLVLGFVALGVHTCVTYSYRFASSMMIGALDYLRIIWAILIGYLFFFEQPDLLDLAGIGLIIVSGWVVMRSPKASAPQNAA
ncbi:MAG: DMT family transporter [Roseibium sp.]|nr:DMT family transporter [Roseibium sp.]